jgi:hypothetical protein
MVRLLVVVLGGCWRDPMPVEETAREPAAPKHVAKAEVITCDVAVARVMKFGRAGIDAQDLYLRHCRDDKWPPEVKRCLLTSNTWDERVVCSTTLTKEQYDALTKEGEARGYFVAKPPPTP